MVRFIYAKLAFMHHSEDFNKINQFNIKKIYIWYIENRLEIYFCILRRKKRHCEVEERKLKNSNISLDLKKIPPQKIFFEKKSEFCLIHQWQRKDLKLYFFAMNIYNILIKKYIKWGFNLSKIWYFEKWRSLSAR